MFLSLGISLSKGLSVCLSMCVCVCVHVLCSYPCLCLSILGCVGLFVEFMHPQRFQYVSVSIPMSICVYLILGPCQSMSALVLPISLCESMYLYACLNVCVQDRLYHVCVCDWVSVGGGFLCMWVWWVCLCLPASVCFPCVSLPASPTACLPLPLPPACFCLSWLVPACLPLFLCLPLSASAVFACLY